MTRVLCLLSLVAMVGCGSSTTEPVADPEPADAGKGEAADRWSTPEGAVKTFIAAAAEEDVDLLSQSFSADSEGEFRSLVEKTATAEMLGELKEMFAEATVTSTRAGEDGTTASVKVRLPRSSREEETLYMVKEGDDWKVRGF